MTTECRFCGDRFAARRRSARFCSQPCQSRFTQAGRRCTLENPQVWFWPNVNKSGPVPPHAHELGQCWEWMGKLNRLGYGKTWFLGKTYTAHRAAWAISKGSEAGGLFVLHRCDNRKCVRADHLFLGTALDNARDMIRKGRDAKARGEIHGFAKLNSGAVSEIRKNSHKGASFHAKRYGVSRTTVRDVLNFKTWRNVL